MKSRRKESVQIRMAIGLVGIRVALIQLLPRRCAPQPFRAGSPRWFLYVFMYGVVKQEAPPPPCPSMREHYPTKQKSGLRAAFLLLRKLFYSGYIGLISPALTWASLYAALFLAPAKYSCGIGLLSGPLLWPSIRQLG